MKEQIIIFDTTLRDGEQALQASLSVKEKLEIALALENMGVDIMEVGFPISSPGDFKSVQTIAKNIKNSRICALARCVEKDIDTAYQALNSAESFRIHIFIATSPIHIKTKLKSNLLAVIEKSIAMIKYVRKYTDDVEFSCEDSGRTPIDNLCRIVEAAIHAGAKTINIPDTVGYTLPQEYSNIITALMARVPNIDQTTLSVHAHDDLGMATGVTIAAIQAGVRQIECTMNGLGERAGNCALEEIVMAIKTRSKTLNLYTNIKHKKIYHTSKIISQICNMPIPVNKAIVGTNAFSHSSGIHQDGVLKNPENYEIFKPESIGLHNVKLNLTSRSGRAAVKHRMNIMGYKSTDYNLDILYSDFLKLADKKGQLFDYDLEALAFINKQSEEFEHFQLQNFQVKSELNLDSVASVTLKFGNEILTKNTIGNGPIDAIYHAVHDIVNFETKLIKYEISARGHGKDALGQVNIVVSYNNRKFHGIGFATDIIASSAKAIVNALNNIWRARQIELQYKFKK